MRRDEHHLWLRSLRGHDAERIRRSLSIVNTELRDGKCLFAGDTQARATLRQGIIVVEQVGVGLDARQYAAGRIQHLDHSRLRRGIPGDINALCATDQLNLQRFCGFKGDTGVIAIVAQSCGKLCATLRQGDLTLTCQVVPSTVAFGMRALLNRQKHSRNEQKSARSPYKFRSQDARLPHGVILLSRRANPR